MLTERQLEIVFAVVYEYIKTGEPVGSRTISRKFLKSHSAATIRNEMSDLEEMGYFTQPHSSAGRLPTSQAYRVYVNSILPARDPAFNTSAKWYEIPDYSNAVKEMCEENGFSFVNNDDLAEQYSQYWEIDGIHLQKPFYPYWAANMMMTVYGEGLGDEE